LRSAAVPFGDPAAALASLRLTRDMTTPPAEAPEQAADVEAQSDPDDRQSSEGS
jgi:hypothetical protein